MAAMLRLGESWAVKCCPIGEKLWRHILTATARSSGHSDSQGEVQWFVPWPIQSARGHHAMRLFLDSDLLEVDDHGFATEDVRSTKSSEGLKGNNCQLRWLVAKRSSNVQHDPTRGLVARTVSPHCAPDIVLCTCIYKVWVPVLPSWCIPVSTCKLCQILTEFVMCPLNCLAKELQRCDDIPRHAWCCKTFSNSAWDRHGWCGGGERISSFQCWWWSRSHWQLDTLIQSWQNQNIRYIYI